ncbi:MAG: nucleotide exchange factor GrpE [Rhodocyclales bacterium]|nr:nucleotide exchange factor GrpE [Rhodocyclales bacterium]
MPDTSDHSAQQPDEAVLQDSASSTVPPEPASASEPAVEVMPSLEELLKTAELQAAEHHDAWLRAKAETENVRRRGLEDVARASKFAVEKFAGEMLAVKDSLEAAITAMAASENQAADNLKAGVELTLKQLNAAFEKFSLVEVNPLGEKFDPHRHQAISQIEAEGEANRVISVLQKGYVLHERVLRPALVVVSKAKPAAAA